MSELNVSSSNDVSTKLDVLLDMNKNLLLQLGEQNTLIQELQRAIQSLQKENQTILADTGKMAVHVEFINATYGRIRHSTFFRTLLG
jgi:hypothetical protein